jgi:hypothetical protein
MARRERERERMWSVRLSLIRSRWDRIIAARMERVAFENSFDGQPETQHPVGFDGLGGVDRAGRLESAGRRHERRDEPFVESGR